MTQRDVSIPTPDGSCDASLHTPDGAGPWPAVIMFPDAGGVRPTFHDMAQQLADLGYAVLLPNVYYRVGEFEPFDMQTVFTDPAERNRLMAPRRQRRQGGGGARHRAPCSTSSPRSPRWPTPRSARPATAWAAGLALTAAGRFPDRVGAAASFHGGQIASTAPDSPHLLAGAMTATVYVAGAENDASFDDEQFERLSTALTEAGVDHTLVTYPAAPRLRRPRQPDLRRGRRGPPLAGARGALRVGARARLVPLDDDERGRGGSSDAGRGSRPARHHHDGSLRRPGVPVARVGPPPRASPRSTATTARACRRAGW